uniref:BTB domain-containing protein n=1 Tax=Panagrolaimus davidi TaxID=227884 RepID=A0A914P3A9_9BILA
MKSVNYINKIQPQLVAAFKSQDPELFDIVFDFEGKKLYADKLILSINSSTFKSMLSDRWISKNNKIKIETYKFDDFKELLTFIYSGECNLTNENILTILDMSEFYQIEDLKELCDVFLSKKELNLANVFRLLETSNKYSLTQTMKLIHNFITQNFSNFIKSDEFFNANEMVIKEFLTMEPKFNSHYEEIFEAVYKWSENRAIKKQKESNDENFNMNVAIKNEMHKFLKYFDFKKMELNFLHNFVVRRGFLFSYDELADILGNSNVKVKITNLYGQTIFGDLPRNSCATKIIKTLKDCESEIFTKANTDSSYIYWNRVSTVPSTPSSLKKKDGVKWYLIYWNNGSLGVKCTADIRHRHYLLAEMNSETDFQFTQKLKISF